MGQRRNGIQRTMLLINVYVPQAQGKWANRAIAKHEQVTATQPGVYATTQLIQDLDRLGRLVKKYHTRMP